LCAQTAQDAIYGFCALFSRSDARTLAGKNQHSAVNGDHRAHAVSDRISRSKPATSGANPAHPPANNAAEVRSNRTTRKVVDTDASR
jgi:hypothetical protein